jgi:hypothetical protein
MVVPLLGAMQTAHDGLPFGQLERFGGNRRAERERAGRHALTARAVTGHGYQWLSSDAEADLAATATAFEGERDMSHGVFSEGVCGQAEKALFCQFWGWIYNSGLGLRF